MGRLWINPCFVLPNYFDKIYCLMSWKVSLIFDSRYSVVFLSKLLFFSLISLSFIFAVEKPYVFCQEYFHRCPFFRWILKKNLAGSSVTQKLWLKNSKKGNSSPLSKHLGKSIILILQIESSCHYRSLIYFLFSYKKEFIWWGISPKRQCSESSVKSQILISFRIKNSISSGQFHVLYTKTWLRIYRKFGVLPIFNN